MRTGGTVFQLSTQGAKLAAVSQCSQTIKTCHFCKVQKGNVPYRLWNSNIPPASPAPFQRIASQQQVPWAICLSCIILNSHTIRVLHDNRHTHTHALTHGNCIIQTPLWATRSLTVQVNQATSHCSERFLKAFPKIGHSCACHTSPDVPNAQPDHQDVPGCPTPDQVPSKLPSAAAAVHTLADATLTSCQNGS
jgi:hypothetical protein